jgi:PAS domain S-box-containing protein
MYQWNPHDLLRFACYLALAIPASCLKVTLPGVTGTMSVLFLFLLASTVELGLPEALIIGIVSVFVQSFWHAKVRPRLVQIAFSAANISIASAACYLAYRWPFTPASSVESPFRLAFAASVFFAVNTFPIAAVIALTEEKSLREVWSRCYCWSFPYYLVGAAIVDVLTFAKRTLDWQAWLLILPVVYVIYRSYKLYLDKLSTERRHSEEQSNYAREIASLHSKTREALDCAIQANAKLDAVIQASPLAILALDRMGNITTCNLMAERIFELSHDQFIAHPLASTGANSTELLHLVDRAIAGEVVSGVEVRQTRKDGSFLDASVWSTSLRDHEGVISGVVMIMADISNHKRLEERLRASTKMEAVGRLAGGIAHDFNNLLTVINGYSALLANSLNDNPYALAQAQEVLSAGEHATELVKKLLGFSRRQVIQPKVIKVNELIREIDGMLRRLIGEHIELKLALSDGVGWIRVDPNQMEAVLMNLASNARDAMPRGGVLCVATERVDVSAEHPPVEDLAPGPYVCLSVADTGQGMDAATLQHIFEPFFTTKQMGKGTGLGLSSVYGGVEQNGGRIAVESEVGKGSTFSIYLPRVDEPGSTHIEKCAVMRCAQRGSETILLVEDEVPVRRMLRDALTTAGYRVWEAANGADALEHWANRADAIDLLVTDVIMPVMNGLQLAEELRKRHSDLSVLLISGHSEEMISNQGMLRSDLVLLSKPFVPAQLVSKVRQVLDQIPHQGVVRSVL